MSATAAPGGARLSDTAILRRLVHTAPEKRIVIRPLINPLVQLGADSIDLRLGNEFITSEQPHYTHIDPASTVDPDGYKLARRHRHIRKASVADPFVLHPERFTLAATLEFVFLPGDIAAQVEGRSTWARLGIQVHATATNVHPWSASVITFELKNIGGAPVELYPGLRMGQLVFFQLDTVAAEPMKHSSKYRTDLRVSPSRHTEDYEIARIRELKDEAAKKAKP